MISPRDAAKKNDELHAEQFAAAEKAIDRALSQDYSTGHSVTVCSSRIKVPYQLRSKLINRYRQAGWDVKHTLDQGDGDFYTFKA